MHKLEQTWRTLIAINPLDLVGPLIIFLVTLAIGSLMRHLVLRVLRSWATRTGSRPALILSESIRGVTVVWVFILAAHLALQGSELPAKITDPAPRILLVLWILSLT